MQNKDFWNTDESIQRYVDMKYGLWDAERSMLFNAVEELGKDVHDIKVLDLGCGGGRTTVSLHKMGFQVVGIDIAENLVKKLKEKYSEIDVRVGDAMALDLPDSSFDIVIFSHNSLDCLFPYESREKALKEINRVLAPKGFFIFSSHVISPIPYNMSIAKNLAANLPLFAKSPKSGFYKEKMGNGDVVDLFYSTPSFVKSELNRLGFGLISKSKFINTEKTELKSYIKSLVNWECYYLAQKDENTNDAKSYKQLFEGKFTKTIKYNSSALSNLYYKISPSTHNEYLLFKKISEFLGDKKDLKILDTGCGGGHKQLTNYGDVYGIDISSKSLENAKKIYRNVQELDLSKNLPFEDNYFDVCFCSEVFGHIYKDDKDMFLSEVKRVLKPNGLLFFTVETHGKNVITAFLTKKGLYQKYWIDYQGHVGLETPSDTVTRFKKFFTPKFVYPASNHLLPLDGYLTFQETYKFIKVFNNSALRRVGNLVLTPFFYFSLKVFDLDTANDLLIVLKNDK